jgi:hypothetical protein
LPAADTRERGTTRARARSNIYNASIRLFASLLSTFDLAREYFSVYTGAPRYHIVEKNQPRDHHLAIRARISERANERARGSYSPGV